jgi:hypothetical protein
MNKWSTRGLGCLVVVAALLASMGCAGISSASKNSQQTTGSQLSVSPASMSFGNVAVGADSSQTGTLAANGSDVIVSSADWTGEGYSVSGISFPATIPAGQTATFKVTFTPQSSGASTGSITFDSNAANAPTAEALSGTGTGSSGSGHTVALTWNDGASQIIGYNIYRGTTSGGPYTRLNSSMLSATTFTDSNVQDGTTYYYVATAIDSNNVESAYSKPASAAVP